MRLRQQLAGSRCSPWGVSQRNGAQSLRHARSNSEVVFLPRKAARAHLRGTTGARSAHAARGVVLAADYKLKSRGPARNNEGLQHLALLLIEHAHGTKQNNMPRLHGRTGLRPGDLPMAYMALRALPRAWDVDTAQADGASQPSATCFPFLIHKMARTVVAKASSLPATLCLA